MPGRARVRGGEVVALEEWRPWWECDPAAAAAPLRVELDGMGYAWHGGHEVSVYVVEGGPPTYLGWFQVGEVVSFPGGGDGWVPSEMVARDAISAYHHRA